MATTVARLQAVLSADTGDFDKSMDSSDKKVGGFKDNVKKHWGAVSIGATAALGAIAVGAHAAIDAASDVNEEISKSAQVFGDASKDIVEWSKTTATSLGISRQAALEYTGQFGNMLVPMGIARGEAAKFSKQLIKNAADMASFNNAGMEETLGAIQSGLAGESEPLRRFGVFLSADRIQAEALASGLTHVGKTTDEMREAQLKAKEASLAVEIAQKRMVDAIKEHGKESLEARKATLDFEKAQNALKDAVAGGGGALSAAAKAQATYNLIQKDLKSSGAMDDFIRTSNGLANSQRIQAAQWEDMKVKLGQGLLPVMKMAQSAINDLSGFMATHTRVVQVAVGVVAALAAGVLAVTAVTKVWTAAQIASTAAQALWNAALTANPIGIVIVALAALGVALVLAYKHSEEFRNIVNGAWNSIRNTVQAVVGAITGFVDRMRDVFTGFRDWISDNWKNALIVVLTGLPGALWVAFHSAWGEKFVEKIKDAFRELRDWIKDAIVDVIVGFFEDIPGRIGGAVKGIAGAAKDKAGSLVDKLNPFGDAANPNFTPFMSPNATINRNLWDELGLAQSMGLVLTSGYRPGAVTKHGTPSDHGVFPSKAIDVSGPSGTMAAFFRRLIGNQGVKQAFYDPLGSIFGGALSAYREGGHSDHVHVATYDKGGFLQPGWNLAYNGLGVPEPVGGAGNVTVIIHGDVTGEELVDKVEQAFRRRAMNNPAWGF